MKKCLYCRKKLIQRKRTERPTEFKNRKFCSLKCYWKNIKGNPSLTAFKKGVIPWNKGTHIWTGGGVKKGHIPWNKGKEMPALQKEKNPRWKGGKQIGSDGYILIASHNHPFANKAGYVREHRLVMEQYLGRYLKPKEVVHHINENTSDNRIENLILFPNDSEHKRFCHHKKFNLQHPT